jgi:hypothetical protein
MKLDSRFDNFNGSIYAKCARALEIVRVENRAAYDSSFGVSSAVDAAAEMHAMRYASPNDPKRAMEYGPDPVVSVVACLFDQTALKDIGGERPRLIDIEVIKAVRELQPIVDGARELIAVRDTETEQKK